MWLAGVQAAAADPSALRQELENARLSEPEVPTERRVMTLGHLELDLSRGSALPLVAGERLVGMFFHGDGWFRYRSEDPYEAANFATNVQQLSGYRLEDGGISGRVKSLLLLDSRLGRAANLPSAQTPISDRLTRAERAFARHRQQFADDPITSLHNHVAQAILEETEATVSIVQMSTADGDLEYSYDALRQQQESLAVMVPILWDTRRRLSAVVSTQSLGGDRLAARPRRFVLREVALDLENASGASMKLEVRETIEAAASLRTLEFALWPERIHGGESIEYRLDSVQLADGTPVAFSHRGWDLVVELPATLAAGARLELRFKLAGPLLYRPGNDNYWSLPIGFWLPLPARLDMRGFTYRGTLRVAKPFVPFSIGETVRRFEQDGLNCAEFRLDRRVQFVVALAGTYKIGTEERDGRRIHLASYAFAYNQEAKQIAHNVFELIRFYEPLLGPFPFNELTIVEINDFGFGVAPPGVIYLTREAFDPGPEGRAYRSELNLRMAHEVAHTWWGHVAQMASFDDQWLSESTAEYYAALAVGRLVGDRKFEAALAAWRNQLGLVGKAKSVYLANGLSGELSGRQRYGLLYAKGPLALHGLRAEIGDQAFFSIFKSVLSNFPFQHVTTGTVIELAEFVTGKQLRSWFDRELFGLAGAPAD